MVFIGSFYHISWVMLYNVYISYVCIYFHSKLDADSGTTHPDGEHCLEAIISCRFN